MGLFEFNVLPMDTRLECLWKKGIYLATREDNDYLINLYAVGAFFVEVRYESSTKSIQGLRSFRCTNCLEPYLEMLPVPAY